MFKIVLQNGDICADMPHDIGLNLLDACYRADIYKAHNKSARFLVVNIATGDIEYTV